MSTNALFRAICTIALLSFCSAISSAAPATRAGLAASTPPYPHSVVIDRIVWDWDTLHTSAIGSDLWPVTWAADGSIFTAWGDGGGFGGGDQDGRVSLGFGRIDGPAEKFAGININGGKEPRHAASFPAKGKVGGLLAVGNRVYGWLNMQNGKWPDVDHALIWSDDAGANWRQSDWVFAKGEGRFHPATFLNFGPGYTRVPEALAGYVYFYGQYQARPADTLLGRAPVGKMTDRGSYEYFTGSGDDGPRWSADSTKAAAVFVDPIGDLPTVAYIPALGQYLLASFHTGPGQLGIFDGPTPWGPWTTVAYEEHWGRMGTEGEGLTCSFPAKWMSDDGRTLWCVFSAYGAGAKLGINAHDRFNLVRARIELRGMQKHR